MGILIYRTASGAGRLWSGVMMTAKSKNKAPKLLPCPFCGGKGDIIKSGTARSARKYHVCCDNERCMLFVGGRWYDTAEEAAEKWNARVYAAGGVRRI